MRDILPTGFRGADAPLPLPARPAQAEPSRTGCEHGDSPDSRGEDQAPKDEAGAKAERVGAQAAGVQNGGVSVREGKNKTAARAHESVGQNSECSFPFLIIQPVASCGPSPTNCITAESES